jgi:hypothetical protein
LGRVTGTVNLDGQPLPEANVEFQPVDPNGSPSFGFTDHDGEYELGYSLDRKGAVLGKHLVRIYTFRDETSREGVPVEVPERLPPRYHEESQTHREVRRGNQRIDFQLTSDPDAA